MDIVFNIPINSVSFGQIGFGLLKAAKEAGHNVLLLPIGQIDNSTLEMDKEFQEWLIKCQENSWNLTPDMKEIRLWHIYDDGHKKHTNDCKLLSFHETDTATKLEQNIIDNNQVCFTSKYTIEVFGGKPSYVPLAFDSSFFKKLDKKYFSDDRITFGLCGKFENRKHHQKIIQAWAKRFGNQREYFLQCAVYNPFFEPQINDNIFRGVLAGKTYFNINFLKWIPTNKIYNDFLNCNNIIIGGSGGEGWGLPEFHSVGIGKHAVILNAHGYKEWANDENSVLFNPINKIPIYDGVFFKEGQPYNQGNIFNWDEEEFIHGCELAIERYKKNPVNEAGLKLQAQFTYDKTLQALL